MKISRARFMLEGFVQDLLLAKLYLSCFWFEKDLCMFEDGSKEALVGEVGVSVSLSIELLEASGKPLEEN